MLALSQGMQLAPSSAVLFKKAKHFSRHPCAVPMCTEWGDFIRLAHAEPIHVWQFMTWPLVI